METSPSALLLSLCSALILGGCGTSGVAAAPQPSSTTLFVGPTFWSAEPGAPPYRGVEVDEDGVVVALHQQVTETRRHSAVQLPSSFAVPGLHDAHVHLAWIGRSAETVDLRLATSPAEVRRRMEAHAAAHPDIGVLVGRGWDQTRFAGGAFPDADDLGPELRPMLLSRIDGHAIWLNRAAMKRVAEQLDPAVAKQSARQRVLRDDAGDPTGVVVDPAGSLTASLRSEPSPADLERWLRAGLAACADAGLVAVHDMATSVAELEALRRIAQRDGGLPLDVFVYLDTDEASWRLLQASPKGLDLGSGPIRLMGVKFFADGALGSRGAALKAPYSDEPEHLGQPADADTLARGVARVHALGKQAAIHAIGDRGIALALDAVARAQGNEVSRRHRIEHAQVIDVEDLDRFAALGVVASMQPTHATSDMRWAEARVGPQRIRGAYAWKTVLARSIPLAFGSDAPIESHDPADGLWAAVTRQDAAGRPRGGWHPGERLTPAEAIRAFSSGAAYAVHRRGGFALGQRFEATLLDRDPRRIGTSESDGGSIRAVGTVRGRRVRLSGIVASAP